MWMWNLFWCKIFSFFSFSLSFLRLQSFFSLRFSVFFSAFAVWICLFICVHDMWFISEFEFSIQNKILIFVSMLDQFLFVFFCSYCCSLFALCFICHSRHFCCCRVYFFFLSSTQHFFFDLYVYQIFFFWNSYHERRLLMV